MTLNYGFIASKYRQHEKYNSNSNTIIAASVNQQDEEPPSYIAVLAEKYHQQQQFTTWDIKLIEMDDMLRLMKKSIQDTQIMIKSYHYCCQKLEYKSQHLLKKLEQEISSISEINQSDTTTLSMVRDSQSDQQHSSTGTKNDSLTRMNQSLENLIVEARTSLNTRLSLVPPLRKTQSCPRFRTMSDTSLRRKSDSSLSSSPVAMEEKEEEEEDERQLRLRQQKRRYLHSQWRLAIAMKQFVQTVQETAIQMKQQESSTSRQNGIGSVQVVHHHHIHYHYHHHHIYHHFESRNSIIEEDEAVELNSSCTQPAQPVSQHKEVQEASSLVKETSNTLASSSSLTSLFKYAFHTVVGGIILPQQAHQENQRQIITNPIKMRTVFLATILMLQRFNKKSVWIKRGNTLLNRWKNQKTKLYQFWIQKSQLFLFILHFISIKK